MVTKEWVEKKTEHAIRTAGLLQKLGTSKRVTGGIARIGAWAGLTYLITRTVEPGFERLMGGIIFGSLLSPIWVIPGEDLDEYGNNYERAASHLRYRVKKIRQEYN